MTKIQYLEDHTLEGAGTLWDSFEALKEGTNGGSGSEVRLVRFKDGSLGLLPVTQISAIEMIVDYTLEDEIMDWNQSCGGEDWVSEPFRSELEDEENGEHIVHSIMALRIEP